MSQTPWSAPSRAATPAPSTAAEPGAAVATPGAAEASEAFSVLLALAQRRTGRVPAEYLVRHVLALHVDADWPVLRAALEATLRRCASMKQEELRVAERPARRSAAGLYRTRRRRGPTKPYLTLLRGLEPLDASCDCRDFIKGSLGLCKHLLAVLDDLAARPGSFERARRASPRPEAKPILRWDPVRPLRGPGDWLERVELQSDGRGSEREPAALARLRARCARAAEGGLHPRRETLAHPARRLELLQDLRELAANEPVGGRPAPLIDPALAALAHDEAERLEAQLGLGEVRARSLRGLRRRLYPYQREGVRRFLASGRLLLADDMGLGKTIQAIAACHALHRSGRVERGLIVAPASLKSQWQREWLETSDAPIGIVEGAPTERRRAYRAMGSGFLIANYEQLWRDLDAIVAWGPALVVLDEAQRIKNWATKTAVYVKRLEPPYRLVLTGTPMENRLEELASIMDWVDEHALEPKWRLAPWHALLADGSNEVVGARNLETLRERLAPRLLRRLRREVLSQLPPRTDTLLPVSMTEAQRDEHDALYPPILRLVHAARRRPLRQEEFLRLMTLLTTQRIIANGMAQLCFTEVWPGLSGVEEPDEALLASLGTPKLLELRPIVANLVVEQGRKLVVFSQWRRMLRLAAWCVAPILRQAGARAVFFTGAESQKRKTQNLVDLHDDPQVRVLFATDAGGVGLNLQRAANACVNLDLPWNPAVLEQRVGRIHRLGQSDPIDVYNLVSQDSIEARIAQLVSDKKALFSGLFDGSSDEVRFDRSGRFLAGIERLLEGVAAAEPGAAAGPAAEEPDLAEESELAERAATDELLAAADERLDPPLREAEEAAVGAGGARPAEGRPAPAPKGARMDARAVETLFGSLQVQPTESGGIRIEAPAEAAAGLAALLRGLAGLLERAGGVEGPARDR